MAGTTAKHHYKLSIFQEDEDVFFDKLEKHTSALRCCAHELVECIDKLPCKTKELEALKNAYFQLETMSVKELEWGIDAIKTEFLTVNFLSDMSNIEAMNNANFVDYFNKQNHFNAEINALVKKAIELVG